MRSAGDIVLGSPDAMRAWWSLALLSPPAVALWLFWSGLAWYAAIGLLVGSCLIPLRRRFVAASELGEFRLCADGVWVVRKGDHETGFRPSAVTPWPGAVLLDFALDDVRYATAISSRSAGREPFRRLRVRLRTAAPAGRA